MPYVLTRADLGSITDPEFAFSTARLLPAWEDIPEDFRNDRRNLYVDLASAMFYGSELPNCDIEFLPGFGDEQVPGDLNKCVRARLQSFEPKHEHKMAGVGFMISCVCVLRPI